MQSRLGLLIRVFPPLVVDDPSDNRRSRMFTSAGGWLYLLIPSHGWFRSEKRMAAIWAADYQPIRKWIASKPDSAAAQRLLGKRLSGN